jgi:hypothetical protein
MACANHPERPAHAVCMSCHKSVCGACATEWDGINYCVSCLAQRRRAETTRAPWLGAAAVLLAASGLWLASAELMVWLAALLAGFL